MEIKIKKGITDINTIDQWYNAAPPVGKKDQWKDGRSAKELARLAISPSFKEFVKKVLKDTDIKEQNFECEPEANSSFGKGMGSGKSRNHDLLMIGETCVIGVEAKVSEGFGNNTVQQEWDSASPNKKKRIAGLLQFISEGRYDSFENCPKEVKMLQYQLLTATVGTVLEAERKKKKEAIILVLVFTGNVYKEDNYVKKCDNNEIAFKAFEKEFFDNNPTIVKGVNCRIVKYEHGLI